MASMDVLRVLGVRAMVNSSVKFLVIDFCSDPSSTSERVLTRSEERQEAAFLPFHSKSSYLKPTLQP